MAIFLFILPHKAVTYRDFLECACRTFKTFSQSCDVARWSRPAHQAPINAKTRLEATTHTGCAFSGTVGLGQNVLMVGVCCA